MQGDTIRKILLVLAVLLFIVAIVFVILNNTMSMPSGANVFAPSPTQPQTYSGSNVEPITNDIEEKTYPSNNTVPSTNVPTIERTDELDFSNFSRDE